MNPGRGGLLAGGILCALTTPFGDDEKPDLGAIAELVDRQVSAGVHGLFVGGTSGEGPLMLREERRLITEAILDRVAGRIPVVVHCGAADTRTSEHLARHAEAVGADAVATVAPFFYRPGPSDLFDHFRAVAEAASNVPHYLYENPERVGYSLGVDLVGRLTGRVPNIAGVNDTGDSIGRLMLYLSLLDPPPQVYTGNNALVYPALSIGAVGAVSALANVVPRLFVEIYDAVRDGRASEGLELQRTAVRFQSCFDGVPYVPALKHFLARSGLAAGRSRRPHRALTDEQIRRLEGRVDGFEELGKWLDVDQD
jgi:4-hydroxy-tetrahydrodipicolinate synthase